jgi:hypothetical protein
MMVELKCRGFALLATVLSFVAVWQSGHARIDWATTELPSRGNDGNSKFTALVIT